MNWFKICGGLPEVGNRESTTWVVKSGVPVSGIIVAPRKRLERWSVRRDPSGSGRCAY